MNRNYKLFVKDIIQAMESIEQFVENKDQEELEEDDMASSAVIRKFEIIGEATKHIPNEMKKKYPNVPWPKMAGMRDRLIHAYFGIDYRLVWDAIHVELPKAKHELQDMLAKLEKEKKQ
ncbi:DUF86 domain-containing protein [archaeon]|nr:DUF86 domain-containing protein [Nanoarchaeota archaeon]MBU4452449.1 DUF86 domain-containing protein [Nanoarchaeota archaeon]MCG2723979.1 DUF86 domain-containing protein [archaeon]